MLIAGSLAAVRSAHAESLPVDLSWEAPSECPSHDEVMSELERTARVKSGRVVAPIHAEAKIERTADGRYRLRLHTRREQQAADTDLDATSCTVLIRGVTLVLALALGDGVDLIDEPEQEAEPKPEPKAKVLPPPSPAPRPTPRSLLPEAHEKGSASRVRASPWLAVAAATSWLPKPSLGAELGLSLGQRYFETQAELRLWPSVAAAPVQGIGSSFGAFVAALGVCGRAPFAGWSFAACGSFEAGAIRGASQGAFQDGAATAPWYAARPSLVLQANVIGPFQVRLEAGVALAFAPPHFAIQSVAPVYSLSRFVPSAALGFAFATPEGDEAPK